MRLFIKTPLAILAENAGGGLVVEGGRIAELVPPARARRAGRRRASTPAAMSCFPASSTRITISSRR